MSANILPDDVLSRLLARVPLREVGLAKQVCKRWRTTFASRAYKVARRDCAEPLWLLMGGNCADTAGGGAITNRCRVFDLSMRPAAPRAWLPHPLRAAGVAMIPEVGVLLLGGWEVGGWNPSSDRLSTQVLVRGLEPGSSWRRWADLPVRWSNASCCALGDNVWVANGNYDSDDSDDDSFERMHEIYRFDKQWALLETIEKPEDLRSWDMHVLDGRLFFFMVNRHHFLFYSFDHDAGHWLRTEVPNSSRTTGQKAAMLGGALYFIGGMQPREHAMLGEMIEPTAAVHVFDGKEWSDGPPLPFPAMCEYAISSADCSSIFVVTAQHTYYGTRRDRSVHVLRNGTWRTYPCDFNMIPRGCAITSYCA